jgi:soluble calcium-activated nucleotidase 1
MSNSKVLYLEKYIEYKKKYFRLKEEISRKNKPVQSSSGEWKKMQKNGKEYANTVNILLIADQDKASIQTDPKTGKKTFISQLVKVKLLKHGESPNHTYSVKKVQHGQVILSEEDVMLSPDSSTKNLRGAELSSLCYHRGKLLTCDDRTGKIYSLKRKSKGGALDYELVFEHFCADRDGSNPDEAFKAEWLVSKDNKLYVGSHGRPESAPGLAIDRMRWVKVIDSTGKVAHENWASKFDTITKKLGAKGYVTHESALWSNIHKRWFFYPRRISDHKWDPKTDAISGNNKFLAVRENSKRQFTDILVQNVLPLDPIRGCADLDFVPCTGDTEVAAVRTVEMTVDGKDVLKSFISIFGIDGRVIMPEIEIIRDGVELKLEGIVCLRK